jgi:hypothetical protein
LLAVTERTNAHFAKITIGQSRDKFCVDVVFAERLFILAKT